jgi:hypothetical protein
MLGGPSGTFKRETISDCPPSPRLPLSYLFTFFLCKMLILLLFLSQQTPLHLSAMEGRLEICRLLLQCNADVEAMCYK